IRAMRGLRAESSVADAVDDEVDPSGRASALGAVTGDGLPSATGTPPGTFREPAGPDAGWPPAAGWMETAGEWPDERDEDDRDDDVIRLSDGNGEAKVPLETLNVLGFGVSRKRLEQAIRELQLPVVIVREAEDADVVITLRNFYKQKAPALHEAEARGTP